MSTTLTPVRAGHRAATTAFVAMLLRDLRVVRKQWLPFLARTVMQPLLTTFVFAYVFPKIGQGIGGSEGSESEFSTLLAPGLISFVLIFQGIQAVALPLVSEFGYTREIEDRVVAPLPVWAVGMQKITSGAIQAALAAAITLPIVLVVPATDVHLDVHWLILVTVLPLACMLAGALGLTIGTRVEPRQVSLMFSILVMPMSMLGCVYYPWTALNPLPIVKWAVLVNPLVYMCEGFRAALTDVPHMALPAVYAALIGFTSALVWLGLDGFRKRVLT
ncbi:MAG: ABC transporter permease [Acidimicrobiia bacterium]